MTAPFEPPVAVDWKTLPVRPCPVAQSLDVFGDRWSMLVIREVMNGVRRFDDLVARLWISRATLSARLRRLTDTGILETAEYDSGRGRTRIEYRLTERGRDLLHVLIALSEWGDRHIIGEGHESLKLIDRTTGHGVRLQLVDEETQEAIEARHLMYVPGPGFDEPEESTRAATGR